MQVKNIISVLAISLTIAVAGPAVAQTTINGTEISAEDLPKVQARCDEIASGAPSISDSISSDGDANIASGDDNTKDHSADATAEATEASSFDLTTLDADACAQLTAK